MEPILAKAADTAPHNEPRDLLSRLYREIGISAVAAALHATDHHRISRTPGKAEPVSAAKTKTAA